MQLTAPSFSGAWQAGPTVGVAPTPTLGVEGGRPAPAAAGGAAGRVATAAPPPAAAAAAAAGAGAAAAPTEKICLQLGQRNCLPAASSGKFICVGQCGQRISGMMRLV